MYVYLYKYMYMYVHALAFHLLTRKPLSQVSETHARDTYLNERDKGLFKLYFIVVCMFDQNNCLV